MFLASFKKNTWILYFTHLNRAKFIFHRILMVFVLACSDQIFIVLSNTFDYISNAVQFLILIAWLLFEFEFAYWYYIFVVVATNLVGGGDGEDGSDGNFHFPFIGVFDFLIGVLMVRWSKRSLLYDQWKCPKRSLSAVCDWQRAQQAPPIEHRVASESLERAPACHLTGVGLLTAKSVHVPSSMFWSSAYFD